MTIPHEHQADRTYAPMVRRSAPVESAAFVDFNAKTVGRADGMIPPKYRELIGLGVALTTQCQFCIASHTSVLQRLGASREEIAETTFITAALRAGAAYTHGLVAMRYFDSSSTTTDFEAAAHDVHRPAT